MLIIVLSLLIHLTAKDLLALANLTLERRFSRLFLPTRRRQSWDLSYASVTPTTRSISYLSTYSTMVLMASFEWAHDRNRSGLRTSTSESSLTEWLKRSPKSGSTTRLFRK